MKKMDYSELKRRIDASTGRKVFDWEKAGRLLLETDPEVAYAYLKEQRQTTGGYIWKDHGPVYDSYTYLTSLWDIPILNMDGVQIECYTDPKTTPQEFFKVFFDDQTVGRALGHWDWKTKWPDSVLAFVKPEDMEQKVK